MCGVIAYAGKRETDLRPALACLVHRGPDHTGIERRSDVTLGHCRLSIIDISARGNQPMKSVSGRTSISFNGEIYNYRALRKELADEGAQFATESDTEVILEGYERQGVDFFAKMQGMWAFALHDTEKAELVLARDPFGIKPLYYTIQNNALYAASELRALRSIGIPFEPDAAAYAHFFNLGYFIAPATPYKNVHKLQPGEIIVWNVAKSHMVSSTRVSRFVARASYEGKTYVDALNTLEQALMDSVNAHYVADVPVSILLSGGNDSSLIAALSKKLGKHPTAYHIAIPGSPDTAYAKQVAQELDIPLVSAPLSERAFAEEYERLGETLDEPTGDLSIIPTALVYRNIKEQAKVVLSGEGGDELFGGYTRNRLLSRHAVVAQANVLNTVFNACMRTDGFGLSYSNPLVQRVRRWSLNHGLTDDLIGAYLASGRLIDYPLYDDDIRRMLTEFFAAEYDSRISRSLTFDTMAYLPSDLLYKSDNASMASSIEARVPFIDRFLWSALSSMSPSIDVKHALSDKRILKDILVRYLPHDLVFRPKTGFGVPIRAYDARLFAADFDRAAAFHLTNRDSFGVSQAMADLIKEASARATIVRKFPRFAFALISSWKLSVPS